MPKLTEEQKEEYIKDPYYCPFCKSENIVGNTIEVRSGGAWQDINCRKCGKRWIDIYQLCDIDPF